MPTSASRPQPGRLHLWPTWRDLAQAFAVPAAGLGCAALLVVIGLGAASRVNPALVAGVAIGLLAVVEAVLEARAIQVCWVAWDAESITLGRDRASGVRLGWNQVTGLRLTEVALRRRLHPTRYRLWLVLRPLNWPGFTADHPGYQQFTDSQLPVGAIGVRASSSAGGRDRLDRALRQAGLPGYAAPTVLDSGFRL
jgi:hypothetical protein